MSRLLSVFFVVALILAGTSAEAQKEVRLSIATGGTGGVYYPMGGGMANIISKYIPRSRRPLK